MTKLTLSLSVLAVAAGFVLSWPAAHAQNGAKTAPTIPHKVGLIDMAHIFKNYEKFTDQRKALKKEIEQSDIRIKEMVAALKKMQAQLKDPTLTKNSPQKKALRKRMLEATNQYQEFRLEEQQRFLGREARIYKDVYSDVTGAVTIYAEHFKYTLILRWSREGVAEQTEPKTILTKMNRLVIYSQRNDDITKPILDHLNDQYRKLAGRR